MDIKRAVKIACEVMEANRREIITMSEIVSHSTAARRWGGEKRAEELAEAVKVLRGLVEAEERKIPGY